MAEKIPTRLASIYNDFNEKYSDKLQLISAVDFDDLYVLDVKRKDSDSINLAGLLAVRKSDGKILPFNPINYGLKRYQEAAETSIYYF